MVVGKGGPSAAHIGSVDTRVYIGNLSWQTTWQDLKDHMRQAGDVIHADVFMEEGSRRSKGCGIVAYKTAAEAQNAVTELNDTELGGRQIFVREDREPDGGGKGASNQANRVYVGNLAWNATWKDLKDHFRSVGEVTRADVMCEGDVEGGRSKGLGLLSSRPKKRLNKLRPRCKTQRSMGGRSLSARTVRALTGSQHRPPLATPRVRAMAARRVAKAAKAAKVAKAIITAKARPR